MTDSEANYQDSRITRLLAECESLRAALAQQRTRWELIVPASSAWGLESEAEASIKAIDAALAGAPAEPTVTREHPPQLGGQPTTCSTDLDAAKLKCEHLCALLRKREEAVALLRKVSMGGSGEENAADVAFQKRIDAWLVGYDAALAGAPIPTAHPVMVYDPQHGYAPVVDSVACVDRAVQWMADHTATPAPAEGCDNTREECKRLRAAMRGAHGRFVALANMLEDGVEYESAREGADDIDVALAGAPAPAEPQVTREQVEREIADDCNAQYNAVWSRYVLPGHKPIGYDEGWCDALDMFEQRIRSGACRADKGGKL